MRIRAGRLNRSGFAGKTVAALRDLFCYDPEAVRSYRNHATYDMILLLDTLRQETYSFAFKLDSGARTAKKGSRKQPVHLFFRSVK